MSNTPSPPVRPSNVSSTEPASTSSASPLSGKKVLAWGTLMIELIVAQVAMALGNVDVLGVHPLAFLTAFGKALQQQASDAYVKAEGAQSTAAAATTTQSQQTIAKPGYLAGDSTVDPVFPFSDLNGSTPSLISVTEGASVLGWILTPDNATKSSLMWLGELEGSLDGFYLNLYQLDTLTGVADLVEASPNIVSSVTDILAYNYRNLLTPITTQVGNYYGVELIVTGSGTYKIAGMPDDWKPANPTVFPQQLGSARSDSLLPAPASFTPTYTGVVPNFGLGAVLFAGPATSHYDIAGTYTYDIPSWMKHGDNIDVAMFGAAGGGQGAIFYAVGNGGGAGTWVSKTLVYGIDIPTDTQVLTVVVGEGGTGGAPPTGQYGHSGTDTTLTGTGLAELDAAGGPGGGNSGANTGGNQNGLTPGPVTFNGVTYTPTDTNGKGGEGAGAYGSGGSGGDGEIWLTAYQAGKAP